VEVIDWLLTGDPAIRWQVLRDILGEPESAWGPERAKAEREGGGAELLAHQDPDGQWAGGSFFPADFGGREEWEQVGQPWTATAFSLTQLREFGLDPTSVRARRTVALIGENCRWDHAGQRYWDGEVEECINGRTVADGAYFGVDVSAIVELLLTQRQPDGGWNCERENGSVHSAFASTINVLEGLLGYERQAEGTPASREARTSGEEYLLQRGLFRRARTGGPADAQFLTLSYPHRWHYDVLRALHSFCDAGALTGSGPDPRLADALDHLRAQRRDDGRWQVDWRPGGRVWFEMDQIPGQPSRWVTLRALRVLSWARA
jgi:hypothetical protein